MEEKEIRGNPGNPFDLVNGNKENIYAIVSKASKSEDPYMRIVAATSPYLSEKTANELSNDKDPRVRMALGRNEKVPEDVRDKLSKDEDPHVRIAVVWNPSTDEETRKEMLNDEDPRVVKAAERYLEMEQNLKKATRNF